MAAKILVVEDEKEIARLVRGYLEGAGFAVVQAYTGREGLFMARRERPDLVVLDLMLPELDGLEVARTLRQESAVPIIMLTARVEETDRIVGLELGADDYVAKPFSPRELVARVRAVLRRTHGEAPAEETLRAGPLEIDVTRHRVALHGKALDLTPSEFALLQTMARQPGRVWSRLELLEQVQGESYEGYERTIDVHIKNLRRKLGEDPRQPKMIVTVFGVGYRLELPG
ncbi:MAG: response regulator transcription factor [Chloroflexi bacterium]|nr:response regulator transcription factor [Chloroflexota bacterium]